jgi:dihydrofolate reductase
MRKVILAMNITIDGFISGPNGELDWVTMDEEIDNSVLPDLLSTTDTALIGRVLYQGFANYWPSAETKNPSLSEGEIEFAHWIDNAPKIVFSKTLEKVEWKNSKLVKENIVEEVEKLKQQPGKDAVLFGGVNIAQTFISLGLIDEYRLLVSPVVLGSGKPLFKDIKNRLNLKLLKSKTFKSGAVALHYQSERK